MAAFPRRLERFLDEAKAKGAVDAETAERLLGLARERERAAGARRLAGALGSVGVLVLMSGVLMTIDFDWLDFSSGVWACLLFLGSAVAHVLARRLRRAGSYTKTAESVHVAGALLIPVALCASADALGLDVEKALSAIVLLWLLAVAPQAWLTRSPMLSALSVLILLVGLHIEGFRDGSPFRMPEAFSSWVALEVGLGIAVAGLSARLRPVEPGIAAALRAVAVVLLFYGVYVLGFYRAGGAGAGAAVLSGLALAAGAGGLVLSEGFLAVEHPALGRQLRALLWATLAVTGLAVSADTFGWGGNAYWTRATPAAWLISGAAWILWFLLAVWCVAYGSVAGMAEFVTVGVHGVTIGILTRFVDFLWGVELNGLVFIGGGGTLLVTAWAAERWRKNLLARMAAAGRREGPELVSAPARTYT